MEQGLWSRGHRGSMGRLLLSVRQAGQAPRCVCACMLVGRSRAAKAVDPAPARRPMAPPEHGVACHAGGPQKRARTLGMAQQNVRSIWPCSAARRSGSLIRSLQADGRGSDGAEGGGT